MIGLMGLSLENQDEQSPYLKDMVQSCIFIAHRIQPKDNYYEDQKFFKADEQ